METAGSSLDHHQFLLTHGQWWLIQILYILLLKAIIKTAIEKLANDIVKEAIELYMPERCRVKQNYRYER